MELITTDMMGPLKKTAKGFLYIMVVCDHYTKWVEAYALRNLTANEAAQRLAQFIFRYGIPETILSDQGTNFQSQVLVELWDLLDIRRARTSPMHPQTDGLSERFNQTLRKMLSAFVSVPIAVVFRLQYCSPFNNSLHAVRTNVRAQAKTTTGPRFAVN